MTTRLATSLIALSTAIATPAMADVSAADVLSNQQALYEAIGVTFSGDLSGETLSGIEFNGVFPMGLASFQIKTDAEFKLEENSDGSVTINYPSPMTASIAGAVNGEGGFEADFTLTHDGYTITATGDAGDIAYETNAQNLRFEAGKIDIQDNMPTQMSIEGVFTMESWDGSTRITEGNLITYSAESQTGQSNGDFTVSIDDVVSRNTQTTEALSGTVAATLPVGGSDLMNLSAALRDGLAFTIISEGAGSTSAAETTMNGTLMNAQTTSTGPQSASFTFDQDGLRAEGDASDFVMTISDQMMFPAPLEFAMAAISMNYDVPLNASEDTQDFRLATSLEGFTVADGLWDMIDPAQMLPRDPADISFDVTGAGTNGVDLLNFMAMSQMAGPPPIEIDEVTIENLRIAAVGAEATATGSMTFDWTDFQTIPGIARPEGSITVNLNGANQLMDTLAAMGLIPEEELMMPRMMLGMFATPVGDDQLETVLEVNEQGHVLANGQRLQ